MKKFLIAAVAVVASLALAGVAVAYSNSVTYSGQGTTADGFGGYDLNTELCGTANGADVDGPQLLWVLTASGASHADITFSGGPDAGTHAMVQSGGGAYKFIGSWIDPAALAANGGTITVVATYDGRPRNVQLTISHGCRPFNPEKPVWCSPGFWKNAKTGPGTKPNGDTYPGAWPLTGHTPSELFNSTVVPSFYDTPSGANPTLSTVLNTPGANTFGGPSGPYGLNAFNATGAYLTDALPGYSFSSTDQAAGSDTCPIDSFGNPKV